VGKAFRGSDVEGFDAKVGLGTFRGLARRVGETGLELGRDGARDRAGVPGTEVLRDDFFNISDGHHDRHSRRK